MQYILNSFNFFHVLSVRDKYFNTRVDNDGVYSQQTSSYPITHLSRRVENLILLSTNKYLFICLVIKIITQWSMMTKKIRWINEIIQHVFLPLSYFTTITQLILIYFKIAINIRQNTYIILYFCLPACSNCYYRFMLIPI